MSGNIVLTDKLEEFIPALLRIARNRISPAMMVKFDEHDAVLSLCASLIRRQQLGRFKFVDNEDLWKLVVVALKRKIANKVRAEQAKKRGSAQVFSFDQADLSVVLSRTPSSEDAICFEELIDQIEGEIDDMSKQILEYKLAGMNNREIATKLKVVERTVGRKLALLRSVISDIIAESEQ